MSDRIQVNGDRLDEIVAGDVTFHFEAMSWHRWWGCIRDKEGRELHFNLSDFDIAWEEGWPITPDDGGELLYTCPTRWEDRRGVLHQCEIERDHQRHRCECGTTRQAT